MNIKTELLKPYKFNKEFFEDIKGEDYNGLKEDNRNQLYLEYLRFVRKFKPKQFIMENVKEILDYKEEIIKDFESIGYKVKTELVKGLDIGMKQKRIRAFFIGELN